MAEINNVIAEASQDLQTIEDFVNLPAGSDVRPRLLPSVNVGTLAGTRDAIFEAGGLPATPFSTKALMTASALVDGDFAQVTDDAVNNGLYVKTAGVWVKSSYDPVAQSKAYSDANKVDLTQINIEYAQGNLIGSKTPRRTNFGLGGVLTASNLYDSIAVPVRAGDTLYVHNDKNTISSTNSSLFAFFEFNPFINTSQTRITHTATTATDAASGIFYAKVTVPSNANYMIVNSRYTNGAGLRTDFNWAVHNGAFSSSFAQGQEYVRSIAGTKLNYESFVGENQTLESKKNLYKGESQPYVGGNNLGIVNSGSKDDTHSAFVPVEFGKTYTISGISRALLTKPTVVYGTANKNIPSSGFLKLLATSYDEVITVTIDDATIKFISFPLTRVVDGKFEDAQYLPIQVEEGAVATAYEPNAYSVSLNRVIKKIGSGSSNKSTGIQIVSQFTELNKVRDPNYTTLAPISKDIGSIGVDYYLKGSQDSAANNLYAKHEVKSDGDKAIHAYLMKTVNDVKTVGTLKSYPFTTPSGSLDNPDSFSEVSRYPNYVTVHPSMAYSATAIGGFKYWMVSSTLPPASDGGVTWEDEDLFVSNDAVTWQRVRSLYESDKTYTTATLRLPPQSYLTGTARKNAFFPIPLPETAFEVSVPENGGMPAVERQTYTVSADLPWKHDPDLIIDGGFVYVYHSFNIRFNQRRNKKSHFFVCVRTSNGVDWDFVRSDGSTLRVTEETSKQLFTKGADGKYNYLSYAYDDSRSNPEVVKFGTGDYELFYGRNFTLRYHGTTPYDFDFSSPIAVKDLSNMNHPTLIVQGGVLYNLSNYYCHSSTDRGATWTQLAKYPLWRGGVFGWSYKKTSCIGDGGKFVVADVERVIGNAYSVGIASGSNDIMTLYFYEYPSFSDFLNKANTGVVDAYIDLQITKVNLTTKTRTVINMPNISATNSNLTGPKVLQRLKVADISVVAGDVLHINVTLNSRNGAEIKFGGIDLT